MAGRSVVTINGYTADDSVNLSDDLFNISSGSTLVLLGVDGLTDDEIEGAGRVSVRSDLTIDDGLILTNSGLFVDMATLTQSGGTFALGQTSDDAVTVRNTVAATWTLAGGARITSSGSSKFVNLGQLDQASGTSTIDAIFYDRHGTIIANGTLDFASRGLTDRFVDDTIGGTGTFEVDDGGVLVGSNITISTVELADARIVGDVNVSSMAVSSSYLNLGSGSELNLTGKNAQVDLSGEIVGAGTIAIHGDDIVSQTNGPVDLTGAVTLQNYGNTTFYGTLGSDYAGFTLETKTWFNASIIIENEVGATWTDTGPTSTGSDFMGNALSYFINDGTFIQNTPGGVAFDMNTINNGIMEAGSSVVASQDVAPSYIFNGTLSGSGVVDVGPNDVILGGVTENTQTISFNGASAEVGSPELFLDDPSYFAATITGFGQGTGDDEISLLSTSGGSWQLVGYQSNTGMLSFTDTGSGATSSIHLSGSYNSDDFHTSISASATTLTGNMTTVTYS